MGKKVRDEEGIALALISEALRQPLDAISHIAHTLLEASYTLTAEQAQELQAVQASSRQVLEEINSLLEVARLEAGEITFEVAAVNCRGVLEEALAALWPLAAAQGVELNIESSVGEVWVRAERQLLYQTVSSLLGHVLQIAGQGAVSVAVKRGRARHEESVTVIVRCESVRGTSVAWPAVNPAGLGLGLGLCRRLARLLGGAIRIRGASEPGATFTLTLPAWKGSAK